MPGRHKPGRRTPWFLLPDGGLHCLQNAPSGFPFSQSVLKSVHLPAAVMPLKDVPARFPDCHIHMLIFRNPGLLPLTSV